MKLESGSVTGGSKSIVVVVDEEEDIALGISIDVLTVSRLSSRSFSIKISILFVKRGVGGDRCRGELRFHAKIEGTTPGFNDTTCVGVVLKSSALKCLEQTLFEYDQRNSCPSPFSLRESTVFSGFLRVEIGGKIFWHQLLCLDNSCVPTQRNTAMCWHF